jgi:hypothetical protein
MYTSTAQGDLFRLDVFPDVAISEDRQQVSNWSNMFLRGLTLPIVVCTALACTPCYAKRHDNSTCLLLLQGKRSNFLSRRWAAGAFRDPEKSTLKGR